VATVLWATDQILRKLAPEGSRSEWRDQTATIELCEVVLHNDWYGKPASMIDETTPARVAFITRIGEGLIPTAHTVIQEGDFIHVMVAEKDRAKTDAILAQSPDQVG
jgi:trk system potassium uptake protein TrkA